MNSKDDFTGVRILVVDDHMLTRDMVKSILRGLGYTNIVQAENGHVALNKIEEEEIGLVICDWNMPNLSGLEVLQEVRRIRGTKELPFLMLTAEAYRENVAVAVQAGVSDYIAKPFTADTLGEKVERILRDSLS